ncbi:uncharacterized protein LOC113429789, partial [Notechis scutatus]|uniref:Uncharacterized protein LOC113429789 n=1 Tax=Notechis scutatus TaxID=8663 RepID=A0A6J1VY88_9SAUR
CALLPGFLLGSSLCLLIFQVTLQNTHEPSVEVNTTDWLHGEHCLRARTSFRNEDKWSNFSEPVCLWLPEERKWEIVAIPLLAILATGAVLLIFYYNHTIKQVETPSALDFSKYQHPTYLLKFNERKLTIQKVDFILEPKITPALSTLSVDSLSKESEDSEDVDDSSSHIPYTKTLRFQKKDENCSTVGTFPTCSGSSSGSGDSQRSGESWPAATMSKPFFTAEWMTAGASSGLLEKTFLSEDSIMDESVSFADDFSAPSREGQEITNSDVDFLNQLILSESHGLCFSTGLQIRTGGVQCRSICASLENSQTSLCSQPERQFIEEWRCENDSSSHESVRQETSLLDVFCKDRVENGERVENNTLKSTGHNYQPRQGHYISRT